MRSFINCEVTTTFRSEMRNPFVTQYKTNMSRNKGRTGEMLTERKLSLEMRARQCIISGN